MPTVQLNVVLKWAWNHAHKLYNKNVYKTNSRIFNNSAMKLLNAWNFPAIFRDSWVAAFCVTSFVQYYFILLYNDKFIVITNNAHQATLWWPLLRFLERSLTPTWRAIARQLIQKEFWVVFSRIQLLIKLSRLAVCLRQAPADITI